jgi:prepilin-type N-terminal cleavage/methylation domain-containing protein
LNKHGFTLVELLVYIVLFAIISLFVGKQFKALVDNYASGKRVSKQQLDSRDIVAAMSREIRNTGLKVYLHNVATDSYTRTVAPGVVASATDNSSFIHKQGDPGDTLQIFAARLSSTGEWLNAVDTIKYYLDGTTLMREYKTTGSSQTGIFADNVFALQFAYGICASSDILFNETPMTISPTTVWTRNIVTGSPKPDVSYGTNSIILTFSAGAATGNLKYTTALSVTANRSYSILLQAVSSNGFPDNLDWLRFVFATGSGTILGSEKFRPFSDNTQITVAVTASATSDAYAILEYSAKGTGTLEIKGIKATCTKLGAYTWSNNPSASEKLNVKAIQIFLLTRSSGKAGAKTTTPITVGEVSVQRSGSYSWRLTTETVEVPNNNVF